ncbi:PucR family transcriptional regulator [Amycolatopsis australiensis]|uniref:PucR C-terminal helix-turn-helix domain-containing protein n=1 Tax=Amycolatopsis australiensis TaxID=546364 RepID=A0A1K1SNX0_9PSEU|nr:helix-turn-helix domain-containing protein [Amycolatopsis australiensis]SFW85581.1 PucR C-terminal helix-turn-helix domain-containing protein [Amycolatopsis australiensis]
MVRLDRLVNVLGGYGLRLARCPVPRSTELGSVVLPEEIGGRAVAGDVLLAVGAGSVGQAVEWAVAARAAVVLVRGRDDPGDGAERPVAVVLVDPAVSWSAVTAVVHGLVLEGRETESGRGPTDLFALADSLAEAVGGAVTIEDRLSRVLAYSRQQQHADRARAETILGRQAPESLMALFAGAGVLAHLGASDEPVFVPADPGHGLNGRMVVAVRAGRELLGSVWVACPEPLDGARRTALTDGARTAALHLLRSRASADLERQVETDLVLRLLEGTADAAVVVSRLGLPPGPVRVIAVRADLTGQERHAALLLAFDRATTGFGWSRPGRSALAADSLYTVLPGEDVDAARGWIGSLRAAVEPRVTLCAGISAPAEPGELPAARREADECLALHETRHADRLPPAYEESWDDILLQRLRAAARSGRAPARGPVAELRRHDTGHGTRYVDTLRAWLHAQGDPAEAGKRLGVHENTVRYRLRKMTELTTLDLRDGGKRLALVIELAALDRS